MENRFTIKNFRVFDEEGATFNFKPITLLTGTNGSGKSSLTKAVVLMHSIIEKISQNHPLYPHKSVEPGSGTLDLIDSNLTLGDYQSVLNDKSQTKRIVFSTSATSPLAPDLDFEVSYLFDHSDEISGNGKVAEIDIICAGQQLARIKVVGPSSIVTSLNSELLLDSFKLFYASLIASHIADEKQALQQMKGLTSEIHSPVIDTLEKNFHERVTELGWISGKNDEPIKKMCSFNRLLFQRIIAKGTALLNHSLFDAFCQLERKDILFYFPVLEKFNGLSKDEACEVLMASDVYYDENTLLSEQIVLSTEGYSTKEQVIEDFKSSQFDSFLEYYRSLEKEFRKDIIGNRRPSAAFSGSSLHNDVVERMKESVNVSFCPVTNSQSRGYFKKKAEEPSVDFFGVYGFLSNWSWALNSRGDIIDESFIDRTEAKEGDNFLVGSVSSHRLFSAYLEYIGYLLYDIIAPSSIGDIKYLGNFHISLRRVFSLDQNDLFVRRIDDYLRAVKNFSNNLVRDWRKILDKDMNVSFRPGDFINRWVKELGIGNSLRIEVADDGRSVGLYITHSEQDEKGVPISDEGYGVFQLTAILISIETQILNYYVDYPLSVVTKTHLPASTLIMEEPESNIHPAFQSRLAEVFLSALDFFPNKGIQFIVETHSEYLIRATQLIVAQQKYKTEQDLMEKNPFVTYYMSREERPYDMGYLPSGRFKRKFGKGFYDEASELSFGLYQIEND